MSKRGVRAARKAGQLCLGFVSSPRNLTHFPEISQIHLAGVWLFTPKQGMLAVHSLAGSLQTLPSPSLGGAAARCGERRRRPPLSARGLRG